MSNARPTYYSVEVKYKSIVSEREPRFLLALMFTSLAGEFPTKEIKNHLETIADIAVNVLVNIG